MSNLLVCVSGGTTTVINATLAGIIHANRCLQIFDKVFAGLPGISGFQHGSVIELGALDEKNLFLLRQMPGSAITGTTRIAVITDQEIDAFWELAKRMRIPG